MASFAPLDMSPGLTGTHVLVTGGAGMIGSKTVDAFLSSGANVTLADLDPSRYPSSHPNLHSLKCDISSETSVAETFAAAEARFGPVSCCVALASLDLSVLPHHTTLADMPLSQWRRTFEINVQGTFLTCREYLRGIRKAKGEGKSLKNVALVLVGSEAGREGVLGNADYSSGKAAVQYGLVQSLKNDVSRVWDGARANAIAPGPVETPQFHREIKANPDQLYRDAHVTSAMGVPVSMEQVAKGIVFLASDNWSGHISGQILNVDGGKFGSLMWDRGEKTFP